MVLNQCLSGLPPQDRSLAEFCTATLISPSWLLTARHCMRQMDGLYVFATIGRPNL